MNQIKSPCSLDLYDSSAAAAEHSFRGAILYDTVGLE